MKEIYQKANRLIMDDAAFVPTVDDLQPILLSAKVQGLRQSAGRLVRPLDRLGGVAARAVGAVPRATAARRSVPVMFGVSVVIFLLMHLAPGDVATVLLGPQATEAAQDGAAAHAGPRSAAAAAILALAGAHAVGDFGISIATQLPVTDAGAAALPQHADPDRSAACSWPSSSATRVGLFAALRAQSAVRPRHHDGRRCWPAARRRSGSA